MNDLRVVMYLQESDVVIGVSLLPNYALKEPYSVLFLSFYHLGTFELVTQ